MVSLSNADAARLARLLEWMQKPAGAGHPDKGTAADGRAAGKENQT